MAEEKPWIAFVPKTHPEQVEAVGYYRRVRTTEGGIAIELKLYLRKLPDGLRVELPLGALP